MEFSPIGTSGYFLIGTLEGRSHFFQFFYTVNGPNTNYHHSLLLIKGSFLNDLLVIKRMKLQALFEPILTLNSGEEISKTVVNS